MKKEQIIRIVETVTGITFKKMLNRAKYKHEMPNWYRARLILLSMLHEEEFHRVEIAKLMGIGRSAVYNSLRQINELLIWDKQFKKEYLACRAQAAKEEDAA